jgi:hypothetical protein
MKKLLLGLVIGGIGFASCHKDTPPLTKQEIKKKVDSLTDIRVRELNVQYERDLEHRMKVEVKVKVDSMVTAIKLQQTRQDSVLALKSAKKPKDSTLKQKPAAK